MAKTYVGLKDYEDGETLLIEADNDAAERVACDLADRIGRLEVVMIVRAQEHGWDSEGRPL